MGATIRPSFAFDDDFGLPPVFEPITGTPMAPASAATRPNASGSFEGAMTICKGEGGRHIVTMAHDGDPVVKSVLPR